MAEPRPKSLRDGPTPRMRALKLQVEKEAKAQAEADIHAVHDGRVMPRRRFESVDGNDYYTYIDGPLDTCRKAHDARRKLERLGKLAWLADIRCHRPEGLPHPLWVMRSQLMVAPKSNPVFHGAAAAASPEDDHWLYLIGFKLAGGSPVDACEPWQPQLYIVVELDGIQMAI